MAGDFKVKASPTQLFLDTSPVIPNVELQGGGRFQGKSVTNSTVSGHISSNSKCRAGKGSSINKTLVFKRRVNKSSEHSSSWNGKSLLSQLGKVDSKPGYSVSGKGLQNTIHQDSFSTKNSKFYKDEQEANCSCGFPIPSTIYLPNLILSGVLSR